MRKALKIESMQESEITPAIKLVRKSMNDSEAEWAAQAFSFYFDCAQKKVDSARQYYVGYYEDMLCGLVGLHHYRWGPPTNVWLSWFAVQPDHQRQGLGRQLLVFVEQLAIQHGYKQLLIETYSSPEFEVATKVYQRLGFTQCGQVDNYLDDGTAMLVFSKRLG